MIEIFMNLSDEQRFEMGKNGRNKIINLYDKKINFIKILKYLKKEDLI